MDALGMSAHVPPLLMEDIWKFCNGPVRMAAHGMSKLVLKLLQEDILMF